MTFTLSEPATARESPGGAFSRGLAIFLGGFSLLNLAGGCLSPGFDANEWWIDFRPLHPAVSGAILLLASALLLLHGLRPRAGAVRRGLTIAATGLLAGVAVANMVSFYVLLARGAFTTGMPLPFSLMVAMSLLLVLVSLLRPPRPRRRRRQLAILLLTLGTCAVIFPLAQMACFGKTDYRRPADVIVVLGARAYADGRPSDALADRVRTAVALYKEGLAPKLIFSGGPGDGAIDEPECMRRFALQLGVRDQDILLDPRGLNTAFTVANTLSTAKDRGMKRMLVVSHFYHLPRVKMSYQRAGVQVYTVPARESYTLTQMPYLVMREVIALWAYYVRAESLRPAAR